MPFYMLQVAYTPESFKAMLANPADRKAAADKAWKDFREDPDWKKAREASEVDGPLVAKVESVYMNPTDFSAIK